MSEKFNSFISFVKKAFKETYKTEINFPTFSNMAPSHQEYILRSSIETKFFEIEEDIDSIVMLSHLNYLKYHFLVDSVSVLYSKYKSNDYDLRNVNDDPIPLEKENVINTCFRIELIKKLIGTDFYDSNLLKIKLDSLKREIIKV